MSSSHLGASALRLVICFLVVVAILSSLQLTQARSIRTMRFSNLRGADAIKTRRGGCAAFGHSCFGGHGKRTETAAAATAAEGAPATISNGVEENDLAIGFPEFSNENIKIVPNNEELLVPAEAHRMDSNGFDDDVTYHYRDLEDYLRFSAFFRKWLANDDIKGTPTRQLGK